MKHALEVQERGDVVASKEPLSRKRSPCTTPEAAPSRARSTYCASSAAPRAAPGRALLAARSAPHRRDERAYRRESARGPSGASARLATCTFASASRLLAMLGQSRARQSVSPSTHGTRRRLACVKRQLSPSLGSARGTGTPASASAVNKASSARAPSSSCSRNNLANSGVPSLETRRKFEFYRAEREWLDARHVEPEGAAKFPCGLE